MAAPKSPFSHAATTPNQTRKSPQKMFVRVPFCTGILCCLAVGCL
jgi:hypothetical protein